MSTLPPSPYERVPGSPVIAILLVMVYVQDIIVADSPPDMDLSDSIPEPVDLCRQRLRDEIEGNGIGGELAECHRAITGAIGFAGLNTGHAEE